MPPSRVLHSIALLLLVAGCAGLRLSVRMPWSTRRHAYSMRGRIGAVRSAADGGGSDGDFASAMKNFFGTNRDTPEARANQAAWAKEQLALEVPEATLDGSEIADRPDLIAQYIASEQEKFGREIDQATAEKEVCTTSPPSGYGEAPSAHAARTAASAEARSRAYTHKYK